MTKTLICLTLCFALFAGCATAPAELAPELEWADGELAAVGYIPEGGDLEGALSSLGELPTVYADGWYETYLIIPRYEDSKVFVYSCSLDEEGQLAQGEKLFEGGGAFYLAANVSDILPNTTVTITHGEDSVSFSPSLSLKGDGEVMNPLPDGLRELIAE